MELEEGTLTSEDVVAAEIEGDQESNEDPAAPPATGTDPNPTPAPEEEPEEPTGTEPEGTEPPDAEATGTAPDEEPEVTESQEDKIARLEKQLNSQSAIIRRMQRSGKKANLPEIPKDDDAPDPDNFDTIEEYEDAKRDWEVDRRVAMGVRKALEEDPAAEIEADRQDFNQATAKDGTNRYKDFETVVMRETLPLTQEVLDTLRLSENEDVSPADVLYYLGKNEAEAVRISRLNGVQLAREIVKIENTVARTLATSQPKTEKTVSDAPEPTSSTDSTVIITKDPNKMTQREYEAWRREGGGT